MRTTTAGLTRLVNIQLEVGAFPFKDRIDDGVIALFGDSFIPGTSSVPFRRDAQGWAWGWNETFGVWPGLHHRTLRMFAGQPDPADASHFTVGYEADGGRGTIDGYLVDGSAPSSTQVSFAFRDGPAMPPLSVAQADEFKSDHSDQVEYGLGSNQFLVRAKSVGYSRGSRREINALMQVDHVYAGPAALMGKQFLVPNDDRPNNGELVRLGPWTDEGGIWEVRVGGGYLYAMYGGIGAIGLPARATWSLRYPDACDLASAIEDYFRASTETRMQLLKHKADSPSGDIAYWAMSELQRSYWNEAEPFFVEMLERPSVTVVQAATLYEVFDRSKHDRWMQSHERKSLLGRIARTRPGTTDRVILKQLCEALFDDTEFGGVVSQLLK